jgi:hypothetical protein
MFLIEFENVRVHKEILALWHHEIVERIIQERLAPVVRRQNITKFTTHKINYACQLSFLL